MPQWQHSKHNQRAVAVGTICRIPANSRSWPVRCLSLIRVSHGVRCASMVPVTAYSIFPVCWLALSGSAGSCSCPCSSQDGMPPDAIARLGKWGMMVPAVTISPSSNFIRAKFLASVSVSNVLVDRGLRLRINVPLLGTSKVTYQACFIFDPDGSHHHALPAVASSSLTRRRRPHVLM